MRNMRVGREEDRPLITQVDLHSRLDLQLMHNLRVHARTCCCQRLQNQRRLDCAVNQHPARSIRGFSSRLSALDHQNTRALLTEINRERESNDAAADDDPVPILHLRIVEECWTPRNLERLRGRRILKANTEADAGGEGWLPSRSNCKGPTRCSLERASGKEMAA